MKPQDIKVGKFYRVHGYKGMLSTIFIIDLEDHKYTLGDSRQLFCEKWIYWDLGEKTFRSFTYLDERLIDSLTPITDNLICLRNMRDAVLNSLDESEETFKKHLQKKRETITIFAKDNLLPDQPSKIMAKV